MMELKFHKDKEMFYRDGALVEEPAETLEELMEAYDNYGRRHHEIVTRFNEEKAKYIIPGGTEGEERVDYDRWEKEDPDSFLTYGMAEFNSCGAIDTLEFDIDLKIMHLNERG